MGEAYYLTLCCSDELPGSDVFIAVHVTSACFLKSSGGRRMRVSCGSHYNLCFMQYKLLWLTY